MQKIFVNFSYIQTKQKGKYNSFSDNIMHTSRCEEKQNKKNLEKHKQKFIIL